MANDHAEGHRLGLAAYKVGPIQPADLGPVINGLMYFFFILTTIIVGLRGYVRFDRSVPRVMFGWGWDDILAISGWVASIPSSVFGVLSTYYGLGSYADQLHQIRALEYFMEYELLYFVASTATKISITLTVVRLCGQQHIYRWIAIGNAILMMTAATGCGIYLLTNCQPLAVYWNPDIGDCSIGTKGLASLPAVSIIGSVFQMVTDVVSATLPFFLISSLQMPQKTKFALIGVLSLGLLASLAAFSRILFYRFWNTDKYPETLLYYTGIIVITSQLELGLGVIACNVPPLRRLFKSLYTSFKSTVSGGLSGGLSGGRTTGGRTGNNGGTQLSALAPKSRHDEEEAAWTRLDDDKASTNSSAQQPNQKPVIFQETTITVEASNAETGSIDHRYRG